MLCMVLTLLLAELRKLGALVVFANFSKNYLDIGTADLSAARAYCHSLLEALKSRDMFEWIEIEPLHFWHSLLFMDQCSCYDSDKHFTIVSEIAFHRQPSDVNQREHPCVVSQFHRHKDG